MPALIQSYEVLLDFANDTHDCASVQLLRDYGRNTGATVLLHPGESVTLVLDAGAIYQYALKTHSKVANVTYVMPTYAAFHTVVDLVHSARAWRDVRCDISQLFATTAPQRSSPHTAPPSAANGVTVDRIWRDHRFTVWGDS